MKDIVRVANCGGFWGDDPTAARRQVKGGPIDYLVMDYLAEVTMAILQKQRQRDPNKGYAADFLVQLRDVLVDCMQRDICIISNAGGVNPLACKEAVEALAKELGVADKLRVGVVLGDDINDDIDGLIKGGEDLSHMETGQPLSLVRDQVLSANVYLGARPVIKALEQGANLIIAGRITDTAVTLAPLAYEFAWPEDDWDRLASGVIAGHIIECGTQCSGGNFTDWKLVPSFENMGYPIVEARADGSFVVTKHPSSGGLVSVHTVSEQLLYEMGSPHYISPDCIAHFDSIKLTADGDDRVQVSGVRGGPAPEKLKVSISYSQGYRAFGRLMISGPDVLEKARLVERTLWQCVGGKDHYEDALSQLVGWDGCHPPLVSDEPSELMLQFAVRDQDKQKIDNSFGPQLVPRVLSTVPGITYLADQGRPRASAVVGYWPALMSRDKLTLKVLVAEQELSVAATTPEVAAETENVPELHSRPKLESSGETLRVPLSRICLARSGDKGDTCNIGVIARSEAAYAWILEHISSQYVKQRFQGVCKGEVERFEVPNLLALNFLLHESLGGGGTLSLLLDAQGKTYAQYLLAAEVELDKKLLEM